MKEYDSNYQADAVDLFEFSYQEEAPIGKLKSLILSIDWEITDEVLTQFNEELVTLKSVWADEKINLVYVQALEKISKYIFQQKANSHPNAIKLLLTFYYNLEKIVSSTDLSDSQRKEILLADVKRFESLKRQIAHQAQDDDILFDSDDSDDRSESENNSVSENELLGLKATVLGIDWEVTDQDLDDLQQEVALLEGKYSESRPKLILLQGIGTLGSYIKSKKNNAHGDSFKLLHLFFESLEKIVKTNMNLEEEKVILFPVVEKFNSFKTLLDSSVPTNSVREEDLEDSLSSTEETGGIQPAFADIPEEETSGFQEDVEAEGLGDEDSIDVSSHIDNFFGDSADDTVEQESVSFADSEELSVAGLDESVDPVPVDRALALEGVDVEIDDDVEEDPVVLRNEDESMESPPGGPEINPALSIDAKDDIDVEISLPENDSGVTISVDKELALQGVDVETEADDDSAEEALPVEDSGKLAPALDDGDEVSVFSEDSLASSSLKGSVSKKIAESLDDFFVDEHEDQSEVSLQQDQQKDETFVDSSADDLPAGEPALAEIAESDTEFDSEGDQEDEETFILNVEGPEFSEEIPGWEEEELIDPDEDGPAPALMDVVSEEEQAEELFLEEEFVEPEPVDSESEAVLSFDDEFGEEGATEEIPSEIDDNFNTFLDLDEEVEELDDIDELASVQEEELEVDELVVGGAVAGEFFDDEEVIFELVTPDGDGDEADVSEVEMDDEEVSDKLFAGVVAEVDGDSPHDSMKVLKECIDSINSGFNDKKVQDLLLEVGKLRQQWATKPLEKTFLQLLSTVIQHIEQYRLESSLESYGLLKSNFDALESLQDDQSEQNQELLLGEISKVLEWQGNLLSQYKEE